MPPTAGAETCPVISTLASPQELPLENGAAGDVIFRFSAPAGLYQFSVIMDAGGFDWEQLYEVLDKYHNMGERTGPWDFSINFGNIPLAPSYWVTVNGERRGLWYFERVSLEDIEGRRFRGKFAFHADGPTEVRLTPYQPTRREPGQKVYDWSGLRWQSARLEADPEDSLGEAAPVGQEEYAEPGVGCRGVGGGAPRLRPGRPGNGLWGPAAHTAAPHSLSSARFPTTPECPAYRELPAVAWADSAFWERKRQELASTHALYREPLRRSFDWAMAREELVANDLLLHLVAHRLEGREGALGRALLLVDQLVAAPAWGNPNPEGYGHNGDMGAAQCLRALAWAWHALGEELGAERRAAMLAKLRVQGEAFFHMALLTRDYWGGSVVQGHGWQALFDYGAAVMHLLGVLPEANLWARFIIPRLRRSLAAMPRDGVIPMSAHQHQYLYLDELSHYRDALLAVTGEDIFAQPQFRPIVRYMATTLHEGRRALLVTGYDHASFVGANQFLNAMAARYGDGEAAYLQARLLESARTDFYHGTQMHGDYLGAVHGFLSYDPAVEPVASLSPPPLTHFPDHDLVHYRDDAHDVALSVQCGPYSGWNSYLRAATCGCDRLATAPGAGHFTLFADGLPLLCSPDGGYGLRTALRSVLLVDGQGQYGDIGYPMSIPAKRHRGEQVLAVRWDETAREGFVRLWLQPAYPEELGVSHYTRDFLISPGRLVVRDAVTLDQPRALSWLFQGKREYGVALAEGLEGVFGERRQVRLQPVTAGLELTAAVRETHVVWAYASISGFKPFDHLRYDTTAPVARAGVDFVFTWGGRG